MSSDETLLQGAGLQPRLAWPVLRTELSWLPEPPSAELLQVATTPAAGLLEYTTAHETGRLFLRLVETFQGLEMHETVVEKMVGDAADVALMLETWRIPAARWIAWTDANWRTFAPEEMRKNRAPFRQFLSKHKLLKYRKELPVLTATYCVAQAYFAPEALKLLRRYKDMRHALLRVKPSERRRCFDRYFRGYPNSGAWHLLLTAARIEHRLYAPRVAARIRAGEYVW